MTLGTLFWLFMLGILWGAIEEFIKWRRSLEPPEYNFTPAPYSSTPEDTDEDDYVEEEENIDGRDFLKKKGE